MDNSAFLKRRSKSNTIVSSSPNEPSCHHSRVERWLDLLRQFRNVDEQRAIALLGPLHMSATAESLKNVICQRTTSLLKLVDDQHAARIIDRRVQDMNSTIRIIVDAHIPVFHAATENPLLTMADVYRLGLQPEAQTDAVLTHEVDVEPLLRALHPFVIGAESIHELGAAMLLFYDKFGIHPIDQVKEMVQIIIRSISLTRTFHRSLSTMVCGHLTRPGTWMKSYLLKIFKATLLDNATNMSFNDRVRVYKWTPANLVDFLVTDQSYIGTLITHAVSQCSSHIHYGIQKIKPQWDQDRLVVAEQTQLIISRLCGRPKEEEEAAFACKRPPPAPKGVSIDIFAFLMTHAFHTERFRRVKIDSRTIHPTVIEAVRTWNGNFRLNHIVVRTLFEKRVGGDILPQADSIVSIVTSMQEEFDAGSLSATIKTKMSMLMTQPDGIHTQEGVDRFAMYVRLIDRTRYLQIASITHELHTHYSIVRGIRYPEDRVRYEGRTCVFVCEFCSSVCVRPAGVAVPKSYIPVIVCATNRHSGTTLCGKCHSPQLRLIDLMHFIVRGNRFNNSFRTEIIGLCGECLQITIVTPPHIVGISPLCINCLVPYAQSHHAWNTGPFRYFYTPSIYSYSLVEKVKVRCWCYTKHPISNCATSTFVTTRMIVDTQERRVRVVSTCAHHSFPAFWFPASDMNLSDVQFKDIYTMHHRDRLPLEHIIYNS